MKLRVAQAAKVIANGEQKRTEQEALSQYGLFLLCCRHYRADTIALRICISPQCGFASHAEGNLVSEDDVQKKLTLVSLTAKTIWSDA